jgi:tRNA pseudouridine13 synthase
MREKTRKDRVLTLHVSRFTFHVSRITHHVFSRTIPPRMALPYLTRDFPGIGGSLKQRAEDFFVQEVPLYEPSGEGEHVYCEVQKVNLTTFDAVSRLARALGVPARSVGYAGLKDARAVTRQLFSVAGTTPERVMNLGLPDVQVLWAARHGNKLRLGHLRGNRFAVKVRDVEPTAVLRLRGPIDLMARRGMPNYFGEQRFGRRGDNDRLGAALVRGDDEGVLKILLGGPADSAHEGPRVADARMAFDAGDLPRALDCWPGGLERNVLARLVKTGSPATAVKSVDERVRRLWVSALQSRLFNEVAARRIDALDRLMDGDFACKHENGACFRVPDAAAEQPRCDRFEISPTGPLLGYRTDLPDGGEPLRVEREVIAASGLAPEHFRSPHLGRVRGARRPLRVRPEAVELAGGADEFGPHVTVAFTLPPGSFATVFLRELMKAEADAEADADAAPSVTGSAE